MSWYEVAILVMLAFSAVVSLVFLVRGILRDWDEREDDRDSLGR